MHEQRHETGRRGAGRRTDDAPDTVRRSPAPPTPGSLAVPVPTLLAAPAQAVDPAVVRRRVDDSIVKEWKTESTVKGTFGNRSRSTALKRIDTAVGQWVGLQGFNLGYAYEANLACIKNIEDQIDLWRKDRGDSASIRDTSMKDLQDYLAERKTFFTDKKSEIEARKAAAKERHGVFHALEPSMATFAGRSTVDYKPERFEDITPDTYTDLLSRDRADDTGKLSDAVLNKLVSFDSASGDKEVSVSQKSAVTLPPDASAEDIKKLLADPRYLNPVTGKTMFPELENVLAEKEGKVTPVPDETKPFMVGGTTITVTYNPGDVNYEARWGQVQEAVKLVQKGGWTVPAFRLNLPKLGRSVQVSKSATDCTVSDDGEKSNRAVFWAPDFMHVSSSNINNPLDDRSTSDDKVFKFSSTALDPSGVATIVHELGHMLHFHNDKAKFQGMWGTIFKGKGPDGRTYQDIAASEVSEYGSKPREMVAEVFLGLVYGRTYSDVVMDMYQSFGGAMPAKASPAKKKRRRRAKKSEQGQETASSPADSGTGAPSSQDEPATV